MTVLKDLHYKQACRTLFYLILLLSLPLGVSSFIVYSIAHSGLSLYFPIAADEIVFWIDAKSIFNVGLHGGYSGYEELLGFAPFLGIGTYGGHGMIPHILTSLIAHFTGFIPFIIINISNWVYLALASLFFALTWRGRKEAILFAALFLCTSYPFLATYTSDWQETVHVAIAIALVPVFSTLAFKNFSKRKRTIYFFIGVLILGTASLLRYSWSGLFISLFLFYNPLTRKNFIITILSGCFMMALFFGLYTTVAAPYPYGEYGTTYIKKILSGEMPLGDYLNYIITNINSLFLLSQKNPATELNLLIALSVTLSMIILTVVCRNTIKIQSSDESLPVKLVLFHFLNVGLLLVLSLLWYQPNIRLIAPNYILSLLLMTRFLPPRKYFLIVLVNLVMLPLNLENHRDYMAISYPTPQEYSFLESKHQSMGLSLAKYMPYQKDSNPWCNTVLIREWKSELLYLPPGIATHYYREISKKAQPFMMRYVYLDNDNLSTYESISKSTHLQELWKGPLGTLYLNVDSNCKYIPKQ